jgi:hypothetical protein
MFGLLAIFPLVRLLPAASVDGWRPALALAALYSALQLTPHLLPGDRVLTGEGRLFTLHMFDARVTCQAWADVKHADGSVRRENLRKHREARTSCGRIAFVDLDVHLRSRRSSETKLRTVIDFPDFCARRPRYHPFRHNDWIRTDGGGD